ncbi:MAG: SufS family cysteine desulfurase [Gammaproteobacteria bacterium]|nr:SufS family cysteine desulfurase [Gammaproteobacteria bacterium]
MSAPTSWPIEAIRADFPILDQQVHGHPLAYLDNAATTQKPRAVIEAVQHYYTKHNANVHRGIHTLSMRATALYEDARQAVAEAIGAVDAKECIFVRGTTEAINLVAHGFEERLLPGDEILITYLEHHSNIVPWQRLCERTGARLVVAPISEKGEVLLDAFAALLSEKVKLLAMTYVSNALGTINPVKEMTQMAHAVGAKVLIDGAQAMPHLCVDVQQLGCDFFAFSGHKVFGPTGIGVLWGKAAELDSLAVYQCGGEMIRRVTFEHTDYAPIPAKFEAGTPNIAGAIGLAEALRYVKHLDGQMMHAYEQQLLDYATQALKKLGGFKIVGEAEHKVPVVSFMHLLIHAHDIGTILDNQGVAIRSGHHCAMPLMDFYKVPALNRLSFAFYNTTQEIDQCMQALAKAKAVFL